MLTVTFELNEGYNEKTNEFVEGKTVTLVLEHSLVSLSKWEAKWNKPFLDSEVNLKNRPVGEMIDYVRCMTINQNVDDSVYTQIPTTIQKQISDYIAAPMTGTTIRDTRQPGKREITTSEIIYYWMVTLGIPFECQKWHLNRLLTLIRVCNLKNNAQGNKVSKSETANRYAEMNRARKARRGSRG